MHLTSVSFHPTLPYQWAILTSKSTHNISSIIVAPRYSVILRLETKQLDEEIRGPIGDWDISCNRLSAPQLKI